ncbi:MAG: glycoside hydrolase family 3 N-terminal domain-containing protein [Lachnospiraceae bacterium]
MNNTLTPEERAKDLLSKMSLDEKMGQINCVFPIGKSYEHVYEEIRSMHGIGQISTLDMRMLDTMDDVASWQREFQKIAMEASEHHIPAVFHMEGLTGAFIQGATSFPAGIARASSWDPELEEQIGEIVARQEIACGITQTLAPVLDISRDSRMGRQGETYGEDPALASALGVAFAKGIQKTDINGRRTESVAKHFMGFHNSAAGIHGANSDVTPRVLKEIFGRSFQAAISEADLKGIMPCYCSMDGTPASASKELLTNILREEMGFAGVTVGDYCAVGQVNFVHRLTDSMAEAGYLCLQAGLDIETPMCMGYNSELKEMFRNGSADISVLDQAVLRILTGKFRMGLFEDPYSLTGDQLYVEMTKGYEKEISLRSAEKSIILLKNDGVLPLSNKYKKILLVGPQAVNPRFYFGGYTHISMVESVYAAKDSMAGVDDNREEMDDEQIIKISGTKIQDDNEEIFNAVLKKIKPECKSILEVLKDEYPDSDIDYAYGYPIAGSDMEFMDEALAKAKEADIIILMLGGKYGTGSIASMGEGIDTTDINLPKCQDIFIEKASELGKPMVGIHLHGRAISSDIADEKLNAILEAWAPSEMGAEAIVNVVAGNYNPGGKLPVSVPYDAGQIPIYYNHPNGSGWHQSPSIGFTDYVDRPHTPRYCFGHGLSYTSFQYSNLKIHNNPDPIAKNVIIDVTVRNIGEREGDEIVQLYIRDLYASKSRPVQELAGFKRIHLDAGEEKIVTFDLNFSQLAFLDQDMRWKVEKGEIEIQIGQSSQTILLSQIIKISYDEWIDGRNRSFYTIGKN